MPSLTPRIQWMWGSGMEGQESDPAGIQVTPHYACMGPHPMIPLVPWDSFCLSQLWGSPASLGL